MPLDPTSVFIIGGGPAGLAAAIAARRKGLTVTVADGARPPIDKACGEGLMPDGLAALRRLGVRLEPAEAQPFRGIRFIDGSVSAASPFPGGCALGVRRTVLHSRMVEAAAATGVRLLWEAPVSGICPAGVCVAGGTIPARWIVGADGFHSRVRRWAGLAAASPLRPRFGFRVHYRVAPWSDYMELHWGEDCQIYITPVGPREVCAALISRNPHMRLGAALAEFPQLEARLARAPHAATERGAITANRSLPRVWRGNVALIGDASGSVDAITGEGLCLAFHQAIALADSLVSGDLARYQAAHRRLARRPTLMSNLMLAMGRQTWLRKPAFFTMAFEPRIFQKLLAFHLCVPNCS
ncbi:MAG TPA: FAD-dependent monooxygenase [Bryobacteraceae bacterium]|nr:FAD-dependent monooxygenase [Bryobacteraceae bacterium]